MLTVTKECHFDAAHLITNHKGQCKNLHGHTYRVLVKVAQSDDREDMVIDFKDLKHVMEEMILARFDHSFIYNTESPAEAEIAAVVAKHGMKSAGIPFRSTAENLAKYFFKTLSARVRVISVQVYETPGNCAEYTEV
ncbi:MAG: 6-carboxytetrahydropterin synthase QueD [Kiritimatiellae bacterium]|nr:6-carboxytetrahydropterin synthase QueD [Kiritimatiellia bacterium]